MLVKACLLLLLGIPPHLLLFLLDVDRDFESRVQKLRSSFTSARRISGELSTIITYLETMVFVLDYVNAHSAASQVAQVAIGMITEDTPNDDHKQLQSM